MRTTITSDEKEETDGSQIPPLQPRVATTEPPPQKSNVTKASRRHSRLMTVLENVTAVVETR